MNKDTTYVVCPGDCVTSIADSYGFFWETIWNLPENSALRNKRKNPNVLMPGDEVFVPATRLKQESRPTDATHKFVRRGVPSNFRIRLLFDGKPRSGLHYTCTIDDHDHKRPLRGTTDSDGLLTFPIPPGARSGILRIANGAAEEQYQLFFGHLNPIDDISGIQQRLHNLGHICQVTGELDEQTEAAISFFRADQDLPEGTSIDDAFRNALLDAHGA